MLFRSLEVGGSLISSQLLKTIDSKLVGLKGYLGSEKIGPRSISIHLQPFVKTEDVKEKFGELNLSFDFLKNISLHLPTPTK